MPNFPIYDSETLEELLFLLEFNFLFKRLPPELIFPI